MAEPLSTYTGLHSLEKAHSSNSAIPCHAIGLGTVSLLGIPDKRISRKFQELQLSCFDRYSVRQLRTKHAVPESTCHTEAILKISKVVLEMVFLQLPVVQRQISMVEEVVREIVTYIAKYSTRKDLNCRKSIVSEDKVGQLVEWRR
jgi:hypothetical protein